MIETITIDFSQILSGLITAIIFIILVFMFLRPWLIISKKISFKDGVYKFKVINASFFKCTDFQIYLREVIVKDLMVGKDKYFKIIDNKENPFIYVPNFLTGFYPSSPNCIQYKVENEVEKLIESNGTHLELIIISKHGLSGLKSITKKTYKHTDCIKEGKFSNGFSFKIN
jgi:hypothetical protein